MAVGVEKQCLKMHITKGIVAGQVVHAFLAEYEQTVKIPRFECTQGRGLACRVFFQVEMQVFFHALVGHGGAVARHSILSVSS